MEIFDCPYSVHSYDQRMTVHVKILDGTGRSVIPFSMSSVHPHFQEKSHVPISPVELNLGGQSPNEGNTISELVQLQSQ